MRQLSATNKYRQVNEGRMTQKEFVRQMRQEFPMYITQFNGFSDSVQILKNKGLLFEAHQEEPINYSLDALDRGERIELETSGWKPGTIAAKADVQKAREKAKANLDKDPNHYINLLAKESSKVDKNDKMKETKRGAADKDTFNDLKKAALKEGYTEEQITNAIQKIKERKVGEEVEVVGEVNKISYREAMSSAIAAIKDKYGEMPGIAGVIKDFLTTHIDDLVAGADPLAEFDDFVDLNYDRLDEKEGKDLDGDGDVDGDDYMAAKDKAIKKAMGKDESIIRESVKAIITRVLDAEVINEAATAELARIADDYASFEGMKSAINQLENIVTDIEQYYDKTRAKIQKIYDTLGEIRNEEGLKVGGFLAPSIEAAFIKDLRPVTKVGFTGGLSQPRVKTISQADIDGHNSGERPLGETEIEAPKQTLFTPVMESKKK